MLPRMMNVTAVVGGMLVAAMPAMAGDFSFGFGFTEGRGGTSFGLNIEIGRPRPVVAVQPVVVQPVVTQPVVVQPVVVQPMITERVWVPTMETAYRDVPVLDAWGRVISYRREAYTIESGYWTEVQRPAPVVTGGYAGGYPGVCNGGNTIVQPGYGGYHQEVRPMPRPQEEPRRHGFNPPFNGRSTYKTEANHRQTVKAAPQGERRPISDTRTVAMLKR